MKNGERMYQASGRVWQSVSNPLNRTSEGDGHIELSVPLKIDFSVSPCPDFMFIKQSYYTLASHMLS